MKLKQYEVKTIKKTENSEGILRLPPLLSIDEAATFTTTISNKYGIKLGDYDFGMLIVIDIDNHFNDNGNTEWILFCDSLDSRNELPNLLKNHKHTFTVKTKSNGFHLYYRLPYSFKLKSKLSNNIEIKTTEITGPNTVMNNGKKYEIINDVDIQDLPNEILNKIRYEETYTKETTDTNKDLKDIFKQIDDLNKIGRFNNYKDWVLLGKIMYNVGFSIDDFKYISWQDSRTQTLINSKWKSFSFNNKYNIFSLHKYFGINIKQARQYICNVEYEDDGKKIKYSYNNVNVSESMKNSLDVFITYEDESGIKMLLEKNNPQVLFTNFNQIYPVLGEYGYVVKKFSEYSSLTESKYYEYLKRNAKVVKRFSYLPEVVEDNYTYYFDFPVEPENNGMLRKFLDVFTVKSLKDKYRIAALIFSAFLGSNFDGKKPLFAIQADGTSSGKTALATTIAKVIEGENIITFDALGKDNEQIGGVKALAKKFVLYDNIQDIGKKELLEITKQITYPTIPAWFMNVSHAKVINNKTYIATFNKDESINNDVLQRTLSINMIDGQEIDGTNKSEIQKRIYYFEEHREEVLADILYYLFVCKKRDNKEYKIFYHPKQASWSETITTYVSMVFPEINEFDYSLSEEDVELVSDNVIFNKLSNKIYEYCSFNNKDRIDSETLYNLYSTLMENEYKNSIPLKQEKFNPKFKTFSIYCKYYNLKSTNKCKRNGKDCRGYIITIK